MTRQMFKRRGPLAFLAALLLASTQAQSAEPLSVHINVTTENGTWAPQFERCIQRGIAAKLGDVSLVAFTPYERPAVDLYVVTQPARTEVVGNGGSLPPSSQTYASQGCLRRSSR